MFRLIGFLVMLVVGGGAFMAVDYNMSKKWSGSQDAEGLTFAEYLGGFSGRIAQLTGSSASNGLPRGLQEMMPRPPEGWTVRPVAEEDLAGFLPKKSSAKTKEAVAYVMALAKEASGSGTETVALIYERGDKKVIFQAIRYPNLIFTSFMAMQQRFELQMQTATFSGTQFMTVRGLDVQEDILPEGMRARYFFANVGAQIHIRVLAPKRMRDEDLVPFFQTLHVKAMNASVIDKQEGLGDVPVIVLASVLDKATREAYEADLASRKAEADARYEEEHTKVEAAEAAKATSEEPSGGGLFDGLFGGGNDGETEEAAPSEPAPPSITCTTGSGGVKRCSVSNAEGSD